MVKVTRRGVTDVIDWFFPDFEGIDCKVYDNWDILPDYTTPLKVIETFVEEGGEYGE